MLNTAWLARVNHVGSKPARAAFDGRGSLAAKPATELTCQRSICLTCLDGLHAIVGLLEPITVFHRRALVTLLGGGGKGDERAHWRQVCTVAWSEKQNGNKRESKLNSCKSQ